jgi:broad specificity phosphatase PhoE
MIPFKPFYFMRHGQTDWNREHRLMGNIDVPLNAFGEQEAIEAVDNLKGLQINRIISSPLLRAWKTADIISDYYKLSVETNSCFTETNWGDLEGTSNVDNQYFTQWRKGITLNNAESFDTVKQRVAKGLQHYLTMEESLLIIAHGGVYWALLHLLDLPFHDITNCEVIYFSPTHINTGPWLNISI